MDENFSGEEIVSLVDADILKLGKKGNKELAFGANSQALFGEKRTIKNKLSAHIYEVARVAKGNRTAPDKRLTSGKLKHGAFADKGWKYKDFLFKIGDQMYSGGLNVAMNSDGKYVYDITKIEETSTNETPMSNGARIVVDTSNTETISQNQDSVNAIVLNSAQNDTEKSSIKTSKFYESTQNAETLVWGAISHFGDTVQSIPVFGGLIVQLAGIYCHVKK